MPSKKKPAFVPLTDAEVELAARALNRVWQSIAYDTLALVKSGYIKREEMIDATLDYVDNYGNLDEVGEALFARKDIYPALEAVLPRLFPFGTYGL